MHRRAHPKRRRTHESRRLILRPYRRGDLSTWREAYTNPLPPKTRWDRAPVPIERCDRAAFDALRARHVELARRDETYIYGAFLRRSGVLVGAVDLHVVCRDDRQIGNLGYQIHRRHRRHGYGLEAARLGLEIAFAHLDLNRMEACIDTDNAASIALARRLVPREGELREGYLWEDGRWVDQIVFVAQPGDVGLPRKPPPRS